MSEFIIPSLSVIVLGYLLGSISFSIIFTKAFAKTDVRHHGSGNAGMTNVLRTAGKLPAILTFVFDFLKCAVAVLVAYYVIMWVGSDNPLTIQYANIIKALAGLFCMIGHVFPLFFGFRGGKGVVTSAALIAFTDWRVFIFVMLTFALLFVIKKMVSLASIAAAVAYPVFTFIINYSYDFTIGLVKLDYLLIMTAIALLVAIIVILKHKSNIKRLLDGTEKAIIGSKK